MPTWKPRACANSQPSSAAWPEIWIGASRKECDNAIEELDRRRTYFGWLKYPPPRISYYRQLRSREKKSGNRLLTQANGRLARIEENQKRHVARNRGYKNWQRRNWS